MTEQIDILSQIVAVSPVVGVLVYFIVYFQKAIKGYKEELKAKDEIIQKLNDRLEEGRGEIVGLGKDLSNTLERLIERLQ